MNPRSMTVGWLALLCACDGQSSAPTSASAAPVASGPASASAVLATSGSGSAGAVAPSAEPAAIGKAFAEELGRGDFAAAAARFSPEVAKALSVDQLKSAWEQATSTTGSFKSVIAANASARGEGVGVEVKVQLERATLTLKLGMKPPSPLLFGVFFDKPKLPSASPPYADASKFTATELPIGAGKLALPGTLVMPKGDGPFPVALLVHGSGPGDQDESLGPNRPFRDLAEGLGSQGVAVLRWDKRPLHLRALSIDPAELTVKEEYLDDVAMIIEFAKAQKGVDPKRVFVVGHSQGGWLMPWFLSLHPELRGGIALAGNARHMLDVLVPQFEFLAKVDDGVIGPLESAQIDHVRDQVALAKTKDLDPKTPKSKLPLGVPAVYWLALQSYDAVATAKTTKQPLLFLNGGRDYQVTVKDDLALWKQGLAGRAGVETKVYPKLNHPFIPGEGPPGPGDYEKPGYVDREVIDDIARFIAKNK